MTQLNLKSVSSLGKFIERVAEIRRMWNVEPHKDLWFRGENKDYGDTALRPELYRPSKDRSIKPIDELLQIESDLYKEFMRCAIQLTPETPEDENWDWDSYFLMQHHEGPTRLLDWTDGALIAVLMALRDGSSDCRVDPRDHANAIVYVLDPERLNDKLRRCRDRLKLIKKWKACREKHRNDGLVEGLSIEDWDNRYLPKSDNFDFGFDDVPLPASPLLVDFPHITPRIAAQRSRFIIFGRDPSWLRNLLGQPDSPIQRIILKAKKDGLRKELRDCGITENVIYPDLDGLGREIRQVWRERKLR